MPRSAKGTTERRSGTSAARSSCPVQVGGGIRSLEAAGEVLEDGASRAILGTAAAADASFVGRAVEEFAERVVVAVDVRGGRLMIDGWREEGPELDPTHLRAERRRRAPLSRHGDRAGRDPRRARPHPVQHVLKLTDRPVIASGGVRNADDVWALRDVGCEAAVRARRLYEKTLKLSQVTRG